MRTATYLTLLVKSALLLSATNANAQGPFTIKGKLTDHRQTVARFDYSYFTPDGVEHYVNDSAVVKDGGFTFKGQVAYPVHAYINLEAVNGQDWDRGVRYNFYLNAGVTTIGHAEDEKKVLITGGIDQQAFDELQKHQAPLHDSIERILAPGHKLAANMDMEGIAKLRQSAAPFYRQLELIDSTFIATHPDCEVALDMCLRKMAGYRLDMAKTRIVLDHFSEKVRQWPPARLLAQRLAVAEQIQPGRPAPDFTASDLSGKPVALSAYRGKYVLLTFANYGEQLEADKFLFNLKNAHKRLDTEGLVMLTALSDRQTDHALELIRANGLDWAHIRNNPEPGKDLARTYGQDRQGGVLIGPDGKLIRTDITFDSDISAQIMGDLPGAADRLAKATHASGGDAPLNVFVGEEITEYPKVQWLKGGPLTHFDKDKIYIVELWATWCVPCVAAMPHLSDLQQKFRDKNVVIIAQQIWENDRSKVEEFVKNKGSALDYWVAYSGPRGSDFDKRWCLPAQVSGIPRTFVIQDGKLVWQTYPTLLNEEILQLLVDRQFTISKAEALSRRQN